MSEQMNPSDGSLSVEELFRQLDVITERLSEENISLEESFELYKKGVTVVKDCKEKIDHIEKQMIILSEE